MPFPLKSPLHVASGLSGSKSQTGSCASAKFVTPSNGFGLHDVLGNVQEWCRDGFPSSYETAVEPGDGERRTPGAPARVLRGGSYETSASKARCAYRGAAQPDVNGPGVGVRPARVIDP